ncbi:MAG: hypothetical protein GF308_10720 [Candidatus Heimdallarchaeota archaeon]|nr:hypothetical protein [Candidatus Heimdallarchaeota archaeon]
MTLKRKYFYSLSITLLLLSLTFIQGISIAANKITMPTNNNSPNTVKNWTFMLFFCADSRDDYVTSSLDNSGNFIHQYLSGTLNSLQWYDLLDGSESDLNVIALYDYPYSSDHPNGYAKIFSIRYNDYDLLAEWGVTNMGSYYTLKDFINYCKTNFPANNYALTLADHGRGYCGYCYDYHAIHPSYDYALGDCLTVEEVGAALSDTGGVDVLFLDTCSGGSFETMWQLAGSVHYAVAGESLQTAKALCHPRDILYGLSRDTTMTPLELAQLGFDKAENPVLVPSDPWTDDQWPSVSLYDVSRIISIPSLVGPPINFKEVFDDFSMILYDELNLNLTKGRDLFGRIRNESTLSAFSAKSMMIDLGHFIERTLAHSDEFYYQSYLESYGNALLSYLLTSPNRIILDEAHRDYYSYENLTGFSICFPNTQEMYQEYLYPNFYEDLAISDRTYWDNFIFLVFPPPASPYFLFPIPEFYEIHIGPIDPLIQLHVIIDEVYLQQPMHIGYSRYDQTDYSMGVEIGVPGAEFVDTLNLGTCTIRIPTASLPVTKADSPNLNIVVNASSATSSSQQVNLTVRHVKDDSILWEANQIESIQQGQVLGCEVSTEEDEWTDLTPEEPTTTPPTITTPTPSTSEQPSTSEESTSPTGFIGFSYAFISSISGLMITLVIILLYKKRKKK